MAQAKDATKAGKTIDQNAFEFNKNSLLAVFSEDIQNAIINIVIGKIYARSTDIWYYDENTDTVVVMRQGMQWFLNNSASVLWQSLGNPTKMIIDKLTDTFESDESLITKYCVDFLLQAEKAGLVEEITETPPKREK